MYVNMHYLRMTIIGRCFQLKAADVPFQIID